MCYAHIGVLELAASEGKRQLFLLIACRLERQATAVLPDACRLERQAWCRGFDGAMMRLKLSSHSKPAIATSSANILFERVPNRIETRPILQVAPMNPPYRA
jgi:hypothetical protein